MAQETEKPAAEMIPEPEIHTRISARELRRHVFVLMFLTGFHEKADREEYARRYLEDLPYTPEVAERIYERYVSVAAKIGQIDPMIGKSSRGWNLRRIGKVELNLLRVAVYEMYFDPEIPMEVAINEAVELGRRYGVENSPAFINGILAEIAKNYPVSESLS